MATSASEIVATVEERPLPAEKVKEVEGLVEQAKSLAVIQSDEDLNWASEFQKTVKAKRKEIEDFFRPEIDAAHQLHKRLVAKLKVFTDPLDKAVTVTSPAISAYMYKRQAEEKAAQEKATKAAEKKGLPAPVLNSTFEKPKGITATETWNAEVTDLSALVRAVAAKKVPIVAVEANMKFLNEQAKSLEKMLDYPGVKAVKTLGTSTRTK